MAVKVESSYSSVTDRQLVGTVLNTVGAKDTDPEVDAVVLELLFLQRFVEFPINDR